MNHKDDNLILMIFLTLMTTAILHVRKKQEMIQMKPKANVLKF